MIQPDKRTPRQRRFDLFVELGGLARMEQPLAPLIRALNAMLPVRHGTAGGSPVVNAGSVYRPQAGADGRAGIYGA